MWFVWSSGSSVPFGTLSSPHRGAIVCGEPRTLRRGCALARRTGSRRPLHPSGAFHGGSFPRSIPRLLASPLPSSTFATRPFGAWRGPRGPYDRGARHVLACARDPPDLDADSPVASLIHAVRPAGRTASLGFVQRSPLHRLRAEESDARDPRLRGSLRGTTASRSRDPSPWFRTTSTVCSSPTAQVCCALHPILGFTVFLPVAKRASSRCGSCPSKLSLRRQRRLRLITGSAGPRHGDDHRWTPPTPRALPPHPSLRAP